MFVLPAPSARSCILRPAERCEARQLSGVCRLEVEYGLARFWTAARIADAIDDPRASATVADASGEIAGFVLSREAGSLWHLQLMYVGPRYRRRGIGSRLVASVCAAAPGGVRLEVRGGNRGALAFYRRQGFRVLAMRAGYYSDGEPAVIMGFDPRAVPRTANCG